MQETIRASTADDFPLHDRFVNYKQQGQLSSAEETASKLVAVLDRTDFGKLGPITDIRQLGE